MNLNLKKISYYLSSKIITFMVSTDTNKMYFYNPTLGLPSDALKKNKFIIQIPSLFPVLKIFLNPRFNLLDTYVGGEWKLLKGDLALFFLEVLGNSRKWYLNYLNYLTRRRGVCFFLKQKIFTKYYTRKVKDHYEIDSDIYSCFLDEDLIYTCAFFKKNDSLETAQTNKYKTILSRLMLENNPILPKVLNIGCGWGSFERFAVRENATLEAHGVSISDSQINVSNAKSKETLLKEEYSRIYYKKTDYVDYKLDSYFSAIVSIGMIEHVGLGGYNDYFKHANNLLKDNGTLLIHSIVKKESSIPTNPWIDKFIFHGGYIPSVKEIVQSAEKFSFRLTGVFIHGPNNYSKTLQSWRSNLYENHSKMMGLYINKYKFSKERAESLYLQWEAYLAVSQLSFDVDNEPNQIAQFQFIKINQ